MVSCRAARFSTFHFVAQHYIAMRLYFPLSLPSLRTPRFLSSNHREFGTMARKEKIEVSSESRQTGLSLAPHFSLLERDLRHNRTMDRGKEMAAGATRRFRPKQVCWPKSQASTEHVKSDPQTVAGREVKDHVSLTYTAIADAGPRIWIVASAVLAHSGSGTPSGIGQMPRGLRFRIRLRRLSYHQASPL